MITKLIYLIVGIVVGSVLTIYLSVRPIKAAVEDRNKVWLEISEYIAEKYVREKIAALAAEQKRDVEDVVIDIINEKFGPEKTKIYTEYVDSLNALAKQQLKGWLEIKRMAKNAKRPRDSL